MPRVRIRLGLRRAVPRVWIGLGRRHDMPGVRIGLGLRRAVACMIRMAILGEGGRRDAQHRTDEDQNGPSHAGSPSRGRTVTTLNMPACMCIRR